MNGTSAASCPVIAPDLARGEDALGQHGDWEACSDDCPGMPFQCDEKSLFNHDGVCVNDAERAAVESREAGTARILNGSYLMQRYLRRYKNSSNKS